MLRYGFGNILLGVLRVPMLHPTKQRKVFAAAVFQTVPSFQKFNSRADTTIDDDL
jgi:hypothetical protein